MARTEKLGHRRSPQLYLNDRATHNQQIVVISITVVPMMVVLVPMIPMVVVVSAVVMVVAMIVVVAMVMSVPVMVVPMVVSAMAILGLCVARGHGQSDESDCCECCEAKHVILRFFSFDICVLLWVSIPTLQAARYGVLCYSSFSN